MASTEGVGELPFEEHLLPERWKHRALDPETYRSLHRESVDRLEDFWGRVAGELEWFRRWDRVLDSSEAPRYRWFVGGKLNLSYLALDVHVRGWRKNKLALIWEGEPVDGRGNPLEVRKLTYQDMYRETNRVAHMLRHRFGIRKGDRITLYMPMVPELAVTMYAAWRIGAVTNVVFSGFSAEGLAERIEDSGSRLVVTADGFWRRGRVVRLKETVDRALEKARSVEHVLVYRRLGLEVPMVGARDVLWGEALRDVSPTVYVEPEPLESDHPSYILYTSGTTGRPKGIVHDTGGWAVKAYAIVKWGFDPGDQDVYWVVSDIGWVTGHTYVVMGPAILGLTQVMYEGVADFPAPDRVWSIVERYGVCLMLASPTLVRLLMRYGDQWPRKHDLSTLRIFYTGGETMNPQVARWIHQVVGDRKILTSSHWGMTETGSGSLLLTPGLWLVAPKPGSCGPPTAGFDYEVVDEEGKPAPAGTKGYLVLRKPWPGMLMGVWGDSERYVKEYWSRFPGMFYTGDYAVRDQDGYIWVLGRADETLKVAGHRLSTYELEAALTSHRAVAEAAVIGVPDEVKGEVPVAFVVLREGAEPAEALREELKNHVRNTVGPIAQPSQIFFVEKLPKTRSGKIMRRLLKNVALGRPLGDTSTLEDEAAVEEVKAAYEQLVADTSKHL